MLLRVNILLLWMLQHIIACNMGSYNCGSGECCICPPGSICNGMTLTNCPPGSYSAFSEQSSCTPCPAGTTAAGYGNTFCYPCGTASYCPSGSAYATPCPNGWVCPGGSCKQVQDCESPLRYQHQIKCLAGTYYNIPLDTCMPCAAGLCSNFNQSSCYSCGAKALSDLYNAKPPKLKIHAANWNSLAMRLLDTSGNQINSDSFLKADRKPDVRIRVPFRSSVPQFEFFNNLSLPLRFSYTSIVPSSVTQCVMKRNVRRDDIENAAFYNEFGWGSQPYDPSLFMWSVQCSRISIPKPLIIQVWYKTQIGTTTYTYNVPIGGWNDASSFTSPATEDIYVLLLGTNSTRLDWRVLSRSSGSVTQYGTLTWPSSSSSLCKSFSVPSFSNFSVCIDSSIPGFSYTFTEKVYKEDVKSVAVDYSKPQPWTVYYDGADYWAIEHILSWWGSNDLTDAEMALVQDSLMRSVTDPTVNISRPGECMFGYYQSSAADPASSRQMVCEPCQPCPKGTFIQKQCSGNNPYPICVPCPQGSYSEVESNTILKCTPCNAGSFSQEIQQTSASMCQKCAAGKYNPYAVSSTCFSCPVGLYSSAGSTGCHECSSTLSSNISSLIQRKPLYARYHAIDWDPVTKVWKDSSGNNRHSVPLGYSLAAYVQYGYPPISIGSISFGTSTEGGAQVPVSYVYGGSGSALAFDADTMPAKGTICVRHRFTSDFKLRAGNPSILTKGNGDPKVMSVFMNSVGEWSAQTGWYQFATFGGTKKPASLQITDWLVSCQRSNRDNVAFDFDAYKVIVNNVPVMDPTATSTASTMTYASNIGINTMAFTYPYYENVPNWAVSDIMIWDTQLAASEMMAVSELMMRSLQDSNVNVANKGANDLCPFNYYLQAACDPASHADMVCLPCTKCPAGKRTIAVCSASSPISQCEQCPIGTFAKEGSFQCEPDYRGKLKDLYRRMPPVNRWHAVNFNQSTGTLRDIVTGTYSTRPSTSPFAVYQVSSQIRQDMAGATAPQAYIKGSWDSTMSIPISSKVKISSGTRDVQPFTVCTVLRWADIDPSITLNTYMNALVGFPVVGTDMSFFRKYMMNRPYGRLDEWLSICLMSNRTANYRIAINSDIAPAMIDNIHPNTLGGFDVITRASFDIPKQSSTYKISWALSHLVIWDRDMSEEDFRMLSTVFFKSLSDSSINIADPFSSGECTTGSYVKQASDASLSIPAICEICEPCSAGTYLHLPCNGSTTNSKHDCRKCPNGTYSTLEMSAMSKSINTCAACSDPVTKCVPGTYVSKQCDAREDLTCEKCPVGFYSDDFGLLSCKKCPDGTFTSPTGGASSLSGCMVCPRDTSYMSAASGLCLPCSDPLIKCPANNRIVAACNATSDLICERCPSGYYTNATGNITTQGQCIKCPPSTNAPLPSGYGCSLGGCGIGTYKALDTQTCEPCPMGTYSDTDSNMACTPCPRDTYLPETGGNSLNMCLPCPMGYFTDGIGAAACLMCSAGTSSGLLNE